MLDCKSWCGYGIRLEFKGLPFRVDSRVYVLPDACWTITGFGFNNGWRWRWQILWAGLSHRRPSMSIKIFPTPGKSVYNGDILIITLYFSELGQPLTNWNYINIHTYCKFGWTCANGKITSKRTKHVAVVKIYPGAYHCFDWEGINTTKLGHILRYNDDAAANAIIQVKNFLAKHFRWYDTAILLQLSPHLTALKHCVIQNLSSCISIIIEFLSMASNRQAIVTPRVAHKITTM